MKKFFASLFLTVGFSVLLHGQGTVLFQNTASLMVTNVLTGQPITGAGAYKFGLYIGNAGDPNPSTLLTMTTNSSFPGRFFGANVAIPAVVGTTLAFQVRGWSSFAGGTFDEAYTFSLTNRSEPYSLVGWSAVGSFVVPESGNPPVAIFGTGPGQVGGFYMVPVTPEPSTYALAALALACWLVRRSVRRSPVSKLVAATKK